MRLKLLHSVVPEFQRAINQLGKLKESFFTSVYSYLKRVYNYAAIHVDISSRF